VTTADWALVISIGSALVSLAGFVWNVWSKFIYPKPHVRVTCGMKFLIDRSVKQKDKENFISISAVNHGPISVTITGASLEQVHWQKFRKRREYGILNPLHEFPNSAILPSDHPAEVYPKPCRLENSSLYSLSPITPASPMTNGPRLCSLTRSVDITELASKT
jgi:hypothetical protein